MIGMILFAALAIPAQAAPAIQPPAGLVGVTWVHSSEPAALNELIYRRDGTSMPASKMRSTWVFSTDGTLTAVAIGETGTAVTVVREWRMTAADQLEMRDKRANAPWLRYQIVALTKDKLQLKRRLGTWARPRDVMFTASMLIVSLTRDKP